MICHSKRSFRNFLKIISIFICLCFVTSEARVYAEALPIPQAKLLKESIFSIPKIPEKLGSIQESYSAGTEAPTIIFIQDAHDSLEAQEHIAGLVEYFVDKQAVQTVFEEGYEGRVPTDDYFNFIQDPIKKQKAAYFLMDKLRLGGAEYAHITRTRDFKLLGIDNRMLHAENLEAYQKSVEHLAESEKQILAIEKEIKKLANEKLPKSFKKWMLLKGKLDRNEIDLTQYLQRLQLLFLNQENPDDFNATYPNMAFLLSAIEDGEKAKAFEVTAAQINFKELFQEIYQFEKKYAETHLLHENEKKIFFYYKGLQLLKKLNVIEISAEEYHAAHEFLAGFNTEEIADFVVSETKKSVVFSRDWEKNIKLAMKFYDLAFERDASLENHLKQNLKNLKHEKMAVLVFGGFHKENIREILKENKISYHIISPNITSLSLRHQQYYKQLMGIGYHDYEAPIMSATAAKTNALFNLAFGHSELRTLDLALSQIDWNNDLWMQQLEEVLISGKDFSRPVRSELRSAFEEAEEFLESKGHAGFVTSYTDKNGQTEGIIEYVNGAFLKLFPPNPDGSLQKPEDWVRKKYADKNAAADAKKFHDDDIRAIAEGGIAVREGNLAAGEVFETVKIPYYDSEGAFLGVIAMFKGVKVEAGSKISLGDISFSDLDAELRTSILELHQLRPDLKISILSLPKKSLPSAGKLKWISIVVLLPIAVLSLGVALTFLTKSIENIDFKKPVIRLLQYGIGGLAEIMLITMSNYVGQWRDPNLRQSASLKRAVKFALVIQILFWFWFVLKPALKIYLNHLGPLMMVAVDTLISMPSTFLAMLLIFRVEGRSGEKIKDNLRNKFWPNYGVNSVIWGVFNFAIYSIPKDWAFTIPIISSVVASTIGILFTGYLYRSALEGKLVAFWTRAGLYTPIVSMGVALGILGYQTHYMMMVLGGLAGFSVISFGMRGIRKKTMQRLINSDNVLMDKPEKRAELRSATEDFRQFVNYKLQPIITPLEREAGYREGGEFFSVPVSELTEDERGNALGIYYPSYFPLLERVFNGIYFSKEDAYLSLGSGLSLRDLLVAAYFNPRKNLGVEGSQSILEKSKTFLQKVKEKIAEKEEPILSAQSLEKIELQYQNFLTGILKDKEALEELSVIYYFGRGSMSSSEWKMSDLLYENMNHDALVVVTAPDPDYRVNFPSNKLKDVTSYFFGEEKYSDIRVFIHPDADPKVIYEARKNRAELRSEDEDDRIIVLADAQGNIIDRRASAKKIILPNQPTAAEQVHQFQGIQDYIAAVNLLNTLFKTTAANRTQLAEALSAIRDHHAVVQGLTQPRRWLIGSEAAASPNDFNFPLLNIAHFLQLPSFWKNDHGVLFSEELRDIYWQVLNQMIDFSQLSKDQTRLLFEMAVEHKNANSPIVQAAMRASLKEAASLDSRTFSSLMQLLKQQSLVSQKGRPNNAPEFFTMGLEMETTMVENDSEVDIEMLEGFSRRLEAEFQKARQQGFITDDLEAEFRWVNKIEGHHAHVELRTPGLSNTAEGWEQLHRGFLILKKVGNEYSHDLAMLNQKSGKKYEFMQTLHIHAGLGETIDTVTRRNLGFLVKAIENSWWLMSQTKKTGLKSAPDENHLLGASLTFSHQNLFYVNPYTQTFSTKIFPFPNVMMQQVRADQTMLVPYNDEQSWAVLQKQINFTLNLLNAAKQASLKPLPEQFHLFNWGMPMFEGQGSMGGIRENVLRHSLDHLFGVGDAADIQAKWDFLELLAISRFYGREELLRYDNRAPRQKFFYNAHELDALYQQHAAELGWRKNRTPIAIDTHILAGVDNKPAEYDRQRKSLSNINFLLFQNPSTVDDAVFEQLAQVLEHPEWNLFGWAMRELRELYLWGDKEIAQKADKLFSRAIESIDAWAPGINRGEAMLAKWAIFARLATDGSDEDFEKYFGLFKMNVDKTFGVMTIDGSSKSQIGQIGNFIEIFGYELQYATSERAVKVMDYLFDVSQEGRYPDGIIRSAEATLTKILFKNRKDETTPIYVVNQILARYEKAFLDPEKSFKEKMDLLSQLRNLRMGRPVIVRRLFLFFFNLIRKMEAVSGLFEDAEKKRAFYSDIFFLMHQAQNNAYSGIQEEMVDWFKYMMLDSTLNPEVRFVAMEELIFYLKNNYHDAKEAGLIYLVTKTYKFLTDFARDEKFLEGETLGMVEFASEELLEINQKVSTKSEAWDAFRKTRINYYKAIASDENMHPSLRQKAIGQLTLARRQNSPELKDINLFLEAVIRDARPEKFYSSVLATVAMDFIFVDSRDMALDEIRNHIKFLEEVITAREESATLADFRILLKALVTLRGLKDLDAFRRITGIEEGEIVDFLLDRHRRSFVSDVSSFYQDNLFEHDVSERHADHILVEFTIDVGGGVIPNDQLISLLALHMNGYQYFENERVFFGVENMRVVGRNGQGHYIIAGVIRDVRDEAVKKKKAREVVNLNLKIFTNFDFNHTYLDKDWVVKSAKVIFDNDAAAQQLDVEQKLDYLELLHLLNGLWWLTPEDKQNLPLKGDFPNINAIDYAGSISEKERATIDDVMMRVIRDRRFIEAVSAKNEKAARAMELYQSLRLSETNVGEAAEPASHSVRSEQRKVGISKIEESDPKGKRSELRTNELVTEDFQEVADRWAADGNGKITLTASDGASFDFVFESKKAMDGNPDRYYLTLFKDNEEVGYAHAHFFRDYVQMWISLLYGKENHLAGQHVEAIYIKPEIRNKYHGLGRALRGLMIYLARARQIDDFKLRQVKKSEAVKFDLEMGFEEESSTTVPGQFDDVMMVLKDFKMDVSAKAMVARGIAMPDMKIRLRKGDNRVSQEEHVVAAGQDANVRELIRTSENPAILLMDGEMLNGRNELRTEAFAVAHQSPDHLTFVIYKAEFLAMEVYKEFARLKNVKLVRGTVKDALNQFGRRKSIKRIHLVAKPDAEVLNLVDTFLWQDQYDIWGALIYALSDNYVTGITKIKGVYQVIGDSFKAILNQYRNNLVVRMAA